MIDAIDCQSFAGGFTLGMAQAGFNIVAKREEAGGFGVPIVQDNAHLLSSTGDLDIESSDAEEWTPIKVPIVFGNPPCSGFSGLSSAVGLGRSFAGTEAHGAINECMWRLVRYAAACEAEIVIMESVQAAYKKGRELMFALREEMNALTGHEYDLIHVLHNSASVGGPSIRKRYFMVLARKHLRFGIEEPDVEYVPNLNDLLGDLHGQTLDFGLRLYDELPDGISFGSQMRNPAGTVDGHDIIRESTSTGKAWLAENGWLPGEKAGDAFSRLSDEEVAGSPLTVTKMVAGEPVTMVSKRFVSTHAFTPVRLNGEKAAPVMHGTAPIHFVHPVLPRTLTIREVARIMGFPDYWSLKTLCEKPGRNQVWLGKGITVQVGEWIGEWAHRALMGSPGGWRGELVGEDEYLIDVTNDHKRVYNERTGEAMDSRSKALRLEMEARP